MKKSNKNKLVLQAFIDNHGTKFTSLKIRNESVVVTKKDVKLYSSFFQVKSKVFKYEALRKIKQKDKIIYC